MFYIIYVTYLSSLGRTGVTVPRVPWDSSKSHRVMLRWFKKFHARPSMAFWANIISVYPVIISVYPVISTVKSFVVVHSTTYSMVIMYMLHIVCKNVQTQNRINYWWYYQKCLKLSLTSVWDQLPCFQQSRTLDYRIWPPQQSTQRHQSKTYSLN